MEGCKSEPSRNWDSLEWLQAYNNRIERFKKLVSLAAPYNVVAREAVLVLHAIAHLNDNGGYSEPETVKCVMRFLERDLKARG